jgi:outer membrane protein OmpA-like peptidoglycan-associated protein
MHWRLLLNRLIYNVGDMGVAVDEEISMFRQTALLIVFLAILVSGCAKPISKSSQGALAGGALGAGTGAIIGSATGKAGVGTAIGAGIGALGGAILGNSLDQTDKENAELEGRINQNQAQLDENRRLIEELKKRGADVRSTDRGVVINLPDILFEFDRANLTPEAVRTIAEISTVLKQTPNRPLSVEGHTDSIGSVVYNKQLSLRRAQSVSNRLQRDGIPAVQINVEGFGEGSPIATNNSEIGRARNRRVEIIIENQ